MFTFIKCCYILLLLQLKYCAFEANIVSLDNNWTVSNANKSFVYQKVQVPSGIFSIYEKSTGESVFHSYNDQKLRWLAYENWTYKSRFQNNNNTKISKYIILTLHGVDTIADIYVNSEKVGTVNNMFVRYRFDMKSRLVRGPNEIALKFQSPVKSALALAATYNYSIPPECPPSVYNGECHGNLLRKMQSSFSWDWGLAAPSVGIWKPIVLEYYDSAIIRDVTLSLAEDGNYWNLSYTIYLEAGLKEVRINGVLTVQVVDNADSLAVIPYTLMTNEKGEAEISGMIVIQKESVQLWWPNGYGKQNLYFLSVRWEDTVENDVNFVPSPANVSEKMVQIGFRTIELIQDVDGEGYTFYFRVNGVNIFMKGSNWIPSDILPEKSTDEKYVKYLLKSAKDANMNMLRVWGGGVYESDYFYELADQYGILIWQDMMFACAMYPANSEFLENVALEIKQNVLRIQSHPSIAIWAANNENEVALRQNWYKTNDNFNQYYLDYRALYVDTIKSLVEKIDPNREILTSSPSNGKKTQTENWISQNPQDNHYGDIHFYEYFLNSWDTNIFPVPRFVSEYGFQSFPSLTKWNSILAPSDSLLPMMKHRQHSPLGNQPIEILISKNLPIDALPNNTAALIYFSQIGQAMAIKAETEVYRSERGGFLNTMGALYWQLNDVWVAPSWSSIEYRGNFKILHYWLKDIFAPETIIVRYDKTYKNILIYGIRDTLGSDVRWRITCRVYKWSNFNLVDDHNSWSFEMTPNSAKLVDKFNFADFINTNKYNMHEIYLDFLLEDENNRTLAQKQFFPSILKETTGIRDTKIQLKLDLTSRCKNDFTNTFFEILVNAPAIFIYIQINHPELQYYTLSKNGFMQNEPIQVVYLAFENPGCSINLQDEHFSVSTLNEFM